MPKGRPKGSGLTTHCPFGHERTQENTYGWRGQRACKICRAIRQKHWARYSERIPVYRARRREKYSLRRDELVKLLGGHCIDCGFSGHHSALDFDHRDPATKRLCLSGHWILTAPLEAILEELQKCELRCANCHRIKTWTRSDMKRRKITLEEARLLAIDTVKIAEARRRIYFESEAQHKWDF